MTTARTEGECLISIEEHAEEITKKPQIEKVPSLLREREFIKNCYDPLVVSIGPYHHGNEKLKTFEKLKTPISRNFCRVCATNQESTGHLLEKFREEVAKVGKSAREFYETKPTDNYKDELFNEMMFLDACFVLHFMFIIREENFSNWYDGELEEVYEQLSKSFHLVLRDLSLLENQIPLQVLNILMKFMPKSPQGEEVNYIVDFLRFFYIMPPPRKSFTDDVKKFLKKMMRCSSKSDQGEKKLDLEASPHILDLMRQKLVQQFTNDAKNPKAFIREPTDQELYLSVTELKSAGIFFTPSQTKNLYGVDFKSRLIFGTLTLPSIRVSYSTQRLLLNLVAYELCLHGPSDFCVISYLCLMDSLIDNVDDIKELKRKRIIFNKLGSDEDLAKFFNLIASDLVPNRLAYADAKLKIHDHCKHKGHVWMAEWVHKYFNSPWNLMAFLGAILALALTMVQTYFTVYQR